MACGIYDVWLSLCMEPGRSCHQRIFEIFGSSYGAYSATSEEVEKAELPEAVTEKLCQKSLARSVAIMDYCTRAGVMPVLEGDPAYPERLLELPDPPFLLYIRGRMPDIEHMLAISVVGTRTMSEYGMKTAYKISYELSAAGVVVISGMALGIDSIAACAALDAGGTTLAVLGCGVDVAYPSQHKKLMEQIIANGAVISEFPPGTRPDGKNFPIRNRIISGLSIGTVVVEANEHSGALITARDALLQGRDIFAVPGNLGSSGAAGTNMLIRGGANIALSARDILGTYEFPWGASTDPTALAAAERISDYTGGLFERYGVRPTVESSTERGAEKTSTSAGSALRISYPRDRRAKEKQVSQRTDASDSEKKAMPRPDGVQGRIYDAMKPGEKYSVDKLMRLGIGMGELMSALTQLEIRGYVASMPGGAYIRK